MTTEELKIKISADTSELKKDISSIKKDFADIGKDTGISSAGNAANASMEELQGTMEQIRSMNFLGLIADNFDKMKASVSGVTDNLKGMGQSLKMAAGEFAGAFDFKYFDVGDDGLKGYLGAMATSVKEAAKSIGSGVKSIGRAWVEMLKNVHAALTSTIAKVAALVAAVAALGAAIANTFSTAQSIKQLNAEAQKIGLSVNAYQEWAYVLEQTGVEASELSGLIKGLTDQQKEVRNGSEDVIRAFNELGMSTEKVINMTQEDLFRTTIAQLQKVTNEVERTSLAYQIFGEDAAHIANLLRLTNQETSDMAAQVHLLGATISGDFLAKSVALSNAVSNLRLAWQGLTNTLGELLMPVITKIVNALTKAIVVVNLFLKTVFGLDISAAASNVGVAVGGIGSYADDAAASAENATSALEKLKRTTMGFDELNIVTNPNASSGSSGGDSGASGGTGDIFENVDTGDSIFSKAQKDIEAFQEKVRAFLEEWKTEIQIVAAALAALGVAGLLDGLGKAIGLGEKFHGIMTNIKKIAGTAITIVLQYSLVNEFMDNYIDGEGFKEYLKGLFVAALGTGILYAMWGPTGLVIGLGVTAAASIKAIIDNGGITNVESAVVALTGLASAIGAVGVAWKSLGLGTLVTKAIGEVGAFIALLKEGSGLTATLAAAFPKVSSAISGLGGVIAGAGSGITGFLSSIGTALGATGAGAIAAGAAVVAAAIAAVVSVVIYLKENWESVTGRFKDFFNDNILPKFEDMQESIQKVGKALAAIIPDGFKQLLIDIWQNIKNVAAAIGEWFASIDWLEAIGKAFEVIGGIIVEVVSGVIAGALNTLVSIFEGAVQAISGAVQIVAGVVEAIVKLFSGDLQGAWDAVKKIGQGIVDVFVGLYDATIGAVISFVQGVIDWFVKLWDELVGHSIVPDMIDAIVEWFLSLPTKILGKLQDFVNNVIQKFKDMWNNVSAATTNKLAEVRTTIINAWNNIKSYFTTNIAPKFTLSYWQQKFDTMRAAIQEKLGAVRTQVMNSWNAIKSYFTQNIAPKFTKSYWVNKFDTIRASISEKLEAARTTVINAWNNIKSYFNNNIAPKFTVDFWKTKFNTIKDGAKAAFNGVISVVESAVNGIIRKINTLSWEIPDWVPAFGGDTFGFNFRTISIPRLAEGGIAVNSTLANIGENGKEAVLPLENNTGWMDMLADRIAARTQAPSKIVLNIDGKTFGWAAINNINGITKQTGGLQLQLV